MIPLKVNPRQQQQGRPQQRMPGLMPMPQQAPMPGMMPMPGQMPGQMPMPKQRQQMPKPGPPAQVDPRKMMVDQIIRDCYSRYVVVDGRNVPEVRYNTHWNIREYSLYPQTAPPLDIPPSQLGSVKSRILVVCTKHLGRVLLQKGKYNDVKHIYQIGRTWDLDELLAISRVGPDSLVLLLNKDYFWKSGEGADRMLRFVHHLASIYAKFTGRYPTFQGISAGELGLPPVSVQPPPVQAADPQPDPVLLRERLLKKKNLPHPVLPPANTPALYKDMDFTVNGKLPQKPMVVLERDVPKNASQRSFADSSSVLSQDNGSRYVDDSQTKLSPYSQRPEPSLESNAPTDSQSFIFVDDGADTTQKLMPTISEYAQQTGRTLPLRAYKPEPATQTRQASENIETSAAYGMQLEEQLDNHEDSQNSTSFQFNVPEDALPDDGIEEVEDDGTPTPPSGEFLDNSTKIEDSAIDESIREIEDFMDTQFGKSGTRVLDSQLHQPQARRTLQPVYAADDFDDSRSNFSYDEKLNPNSAQYRSMAETPATDTESIKQVGVKLEKDAEIDELLDEMGWNVTDDSDNLVKMLNKELADIKHKNILELTTLDFGKDTLANEVTASTNEVQNLLEIFKRMETNFNMVAPLINEIESNSKGLQVEAVNKKILYNDLSEVLNKVKVSSRDLKDIANYTAFDDMQLIPALEQKLLILYDALGAIGHNSGDDLSQMQALKQFQDIYESAAHAFIDRFNSYVLNDFERSVTALNKEVSSLYPRNLLTALRGLYAFVGVSNFEKCISEKDSRALNDRLNSQLATLLENILASRIKNIRTNSSATIGSRLSQNFDAASLKKTKSSRFGSTRLINRLTHGAADETSKRKSHTELPAGSPDEISDPKIILRMVQESKELMLVVQYFCGNFYHSTAMTEYSEYVKQYPFEDRMRDFEDPDLHLINYKTNSNDLLQSMNSIFGNYINRFVKKMSPAGLITPQLLLELYRLVKDATVKSQDFVGYSFLMKLIDRYKVVWTKLISNQVDSLIKSDLRAKGEILPAVRNLNQILLTTETSLEGADAHRDEEAAEGVVELISKSYESLTEAAVTLFSKEDPMLKSNAHDEKEKAHRNVAILQNIFAISQQLNEFTSPATNNMRQKLDVVFGRVQEDYYNYSLHRTLNKMSDFVNSHLESENSGKRKKDEKILIKGLASTHGVKDIQPKIAEMRRKLEKHFITSHTVTEQDLVQKMWKDLETKVTQLFQKFDSIVRSVDRDIDGYASVSEIRRLFQQTR